MYLKTHSKTTLNSLKKFCENENVILLSSLFYSSHIDVISNDEFIHQLRSHQTLIKDTLNKFSTTIFLHDNYKTSKNFLTQNYNHIKDLDYDTILFIPKLISGVYELDAKGIINHEKRELHLYTTKEFIDLDFSDDLKDFWKNITNKIIFTTQRFFWRKTKSELNETFKAISKLNLINFKSEIQEIKPTKKISKKTKLHKYEIDLDELFLQKQTNDDLDNEESNSIINEEKEYEQKPFIYTLNELDDYEHEEIKSNLIEEFKEMYDLILLLNDKQALDDWRHLSSKINYVDKENIHEYEQTHRYENYISLMNSLNDIAYKLKTGFLLKNGLDITEPQIVEHPAKELKEVIFNTKFWLKVYLIIFIIYQ